MSPNLSPPRSIRRAVSGWGRGPAWLAALLLLAAAVAAGTARAALPEPPVLPGQLTLDEALRVFRARGLDLLLMEAAVAGAEGDVRAAGAVANPAVGIGYSRTFTYEPDDPSCQGEGLLCTAHGLSASLSDQGALASVLVGKRGLRLRVAQLALQAARHGREDAQRTLEFQLKQQYVQTVLARELLDFALEVKSKASQTLSLHQIRYKTGAISEADLARVETAALEAEQSVASARQALENARSGLALLLGVRGPVPPFEVAQDLPAYQVPAPLRAASLDSLWALALQRRPDLQGLQRKREQALASLSLARRQRVPDAALSLSYQQIGYGGAGTNAPLAPPTLTIGLSTALPVFYQLQGEILRAQADSRAQDLLCAKAEAQVASDVATAYTNFLTARELVDRMQARLLDRALRARDLVAFQYQKGSASLLEFLDAQRTYIGINQEYLQDLSSYWIAVFQLEQATGAELRL